MRGLTAIAAALGASALHAVAASVSAAPQEDGPFTRARLMAEGNKRDLYQGIKSKGRQGASGRAAEMAAAMPRRATGQPTNPFAHRSRRQAFDAAMRDGAAIIRNPDALRRQAMKIARRVAA